MADRTSSGGAAGGGAPELTLLSLFATPLVIMCVVFPSWLSHGVRRYRGTRERISIAVNFSLGGA